MPISKETFDRSAYVNPQRAPFNEWAFWSWNENSDHITASAKLCKILDTTPSEIKSIGDLSKFFKNPKPENFITQLRQDIAASCDFIYEAEIITNKGQSKILSFQGDCMVDEHNNAIGITGICIDITAKKKTSALESTLHNNEEFILKLLQYSPNALMIHTPSGLIIYANSKTAELFNVPNKDDLTSRNFEEFIPKKNIEELRERIESVIKSGEPIPNFEQEFICMDGATRVGETLIIPFNWRGTTAILSVIRDITEQKRYVGELRTSEENLKQLIKSTPLSLAMYDKNMNYIACSSKFLEDWWVKKEPMNIEKIVGLNHYELFGDVKEEWKKYHKKTLEGATVLKEDDSFIKSDGKKEWLRWQTTPWRDMDGNIQGMVIFTEFITERKEYEELIKNSRSKLSMILENIPGMVYGCDNDDQWTMNFVSNGSLELTGYAPEEFLEEPEPISFKKITHPDDLDNVIKTMRECIDKQQIFEVRYRIYTKSGELKFLFERGQGVFDEEGNLLSIEGIVLDISEQKIAEDDLRRSQANLAEAQRVANLGSWQWNLESHELLWSDEFYRIYGLEPQEISPSIEQYIEMFHPDDRDYASHALMNVLKHPEASEFDSRIVRKDGKIRYVTYNTEISTDKDNNPIKIIGTIQDITEKREADIALQASEERNRALLSALPDLIFILTKEGVYIDYQVPDSDLLVFPPEVFLGKSVLELFEKDLANDFIEKFEATHRTNKIQTLEYSIILHDEVKYYEARIVKYSTDQVLVVIRDVTKAKTSEMKARESERRFFKAFHISPIPIVISQFEEGKILEANERFLQLIDMSREEVIGSSNVNMGTWVDNANKEAFKAQLVDKGKVYGFDATLRIHDGRFKDVLLSAEFINIDDKQCVLLMIFDISERKKAENQLLKLTEELTASNHELRQFAYITSHNLRAPIVNIDTLLQFLDKNNLDAPGNLELIDKIDLSVGQLKDTLNELIQLVALKDSRHEPDEKIYFEEIYNIVTQNLTIQIANANASISTDFKESAIMFKKPMLESIIQNLLSNALKYKSEKPLEINIRTYREGQYICMTVEDNGKGIDLSLHKERLFGMYQRFHENIEGKGLGLYIIKSQIESMGGKIDVSSTPGEGSTFKVYFKNHKKNKTPE